MPATPGHDSGVRIPLFQVAANSYEKPYVAAAVLTSALLFSLGVFAAYRLTRDYLGAEHPLLLVQ